MTSALRWAAMTAILMFHNCEGQSHKTMSTHHNFWSERIAEADFNWGPSAYQPNALPLGQTGSLENILFVFHSWLLIPTLRQLQRCSTLNTDLFKSAVQQVYFHFGPFGPYLYCYKQAFFFFFFFHKVPSFIIIHIEDYVVDTVSVTVTVRVCTTV